MYFTFAWRYFKAKKSANAINVIAWVTVGVIAFATACQILVLSVFNGFEGLVKSLYGAFYTDIRIVPAQGKTFTLDPAQINQVKKTGGINNISMIAEEKALLQNGDQQKTVFLKGVDDNYTNVTAVAAKTIIGKFETGTVDEPSVVIGYGVQNAAGITVDKRFEASTVTIILPKKGKVSVSDPMKSLSEGNVTTKGVFAIQQDFDEKYVITNIGFAKQQIGLDSNEYSACEIKLNADADINVVQAQLQHQLGKAYAVQTRYEQNQSMYSTMRMEKWFIYAILTLIQIIVAFNMISALSMLVLEKQKDINILQSMGAARNMILKIFLGEGLLLMGIGGAAGIILALIICWLQVTFKLVKLSGGTFLIDYFPVELKLTDFILVLCTLSIIAFTASWLPSKKAANQPLELR